MDADIAKMTGQNSGEKVTAYKLNEVRMSGDDGSFSFRCLLSEKKDGKYVSQPLGKTVDGVILKMRWRLAKYNEPPAQSYMTSEYDFKTTDTVIEFSTKKKGTAAQIKEELGLGSQRVLYVYVPAQKEIVRVIVKPSALSSENNPGKEFGLFDYVQSFTDENIGVHEFVTQFGSVHRPDKNGNKRKDYFAMTFTRGRALTETEKEKVIGLIREVHEKTGATAFAEAYNGEPETNNEAPGIEYPKDDIHPEDIPF